MRTLEILPGWRPEGGVPNPGPSARPPTRDRTDYPVRHPGPDSSRFSGHGIWNVPSRDPATGAACLTKEGSLGSLPTFFPSLCSPQMVTETQFSPKDQQRIFPLTLFC